MADVAEMAAGHLPHGWGDQPAALVSPMADVAEMAAGHLPHGWGDQPAALPPMIANVDQEAGRATPTIYPRAGEMSGRTEGGVTEPIPSRRWPLPQEQPHDTEIIDLLIGLLKVLEKSKLEADYWQAQNIAFRMQQTIYDDYIKRFEQDDKEAAQWLGKFDTLCSNLNLKTKHGIHSVSHLQAASIG